MKKYAIIGYPLTHSISQFIHESLFNLSKVDASYEVLQTPPENFDELETLLNSLDGYNVTIPYKNAALKFTDSLDDFSKISGSVNVIKNADIRLGYNTDVFGFCETLKAQGIDPKKECDCLILGCGGTGRMVLTYLASVQKKISVAVLNPADPELNEIKNNLNALYPACEITFVDIKSSDISGDLCINTTPAGMFPNINASPLSDEQIKRCGTIFDLVYNPLETLLVKKAHSFGISASTGLLMLVLQAVKAHEIWYGACFSPEQINTIYEACKTKM
ncbi:MAG: shikimate dehydrogenase [Oscillospiraceae bacterium]